MHLGLKINRRHRRKSRSLKELRHRTFCGRRTPTCKQASNNQQAPETETETETQARAEKGESGVNSFTFHSPILTLILVPVIKAKNLSGRHFLGEAGRLRAVAALQAELRPRFSGHIAGCRYSAVQLHS